MLCDGSCLVKQQKSETITFEDGTKLSFYWCSHEHTYVLTDYFPEKKEKPKTEGEPPCT